MRGVEAEVFHPKEMRHGLAMGEWDDFRPRMRLSAVFRFFAEKPCQALLSIFGGFFTPRISTS